MGAIDPINASITQLGQEMSILPTEPIYSKLLLTTLKSEYKPIKYEIASIISMLSVENIFYFDSRMNDKKEIYILN